MQETQYFDAGSDIARLRREFFTDTNDAELQFKMENRLTELESEGHSFVRREKIGRNETCPCGSGAKFKNCCIEKIR